MRPWRRLGASWATLERQVGPGRAPLGFRQPSLHTITRKGAIFEGFRGPAGIARVLKNQCFRQKSWSNLGKVDPWWESRKSMKNRWTNDAKMGGLDRQMSAPLIVEAWFRRFGVSSQKHKNEVNKFWGVVKNEAPGNPGLIFGAPMLDLEGYEKRQKNLDLLFCYVFLKIFISF